MPLGKGLESLIPKKDNAPEEPVALDVLQAQASLHEPVYRFHDGDPSPHLASFDAEEEVVATVAPVPPSAPVPRPRRTESVFWIDIEKIEPNPHQPRRDFNEEQLAALAESIRERGMLQPLVVTKREIEAPSGLNVRYQLIVGERRLRAAKLAGLREVPVMIRTVEMPEREKLELALIENVQREDLNPLERARAFQKLIEDFGLMQKEVAIRIGKSREVVANALRLLRLPQEIQAALASGDITEGHARTILMLEHDPVEQSKLFYEIRTAGFSVREAEMAARAAGGMSLRPKQRSSRVRLDPDSRELQRRLEEVFGTRVKLIKRGEHGKIIVEFYSDEELQGILNRVTRHGPEYV